MSTTIREYRDGDGTGIARIGLENGAYYAALAPEYFRQPDEEGLADFLDGDGEWRDAPTNLALVAEVDGTVAGYLEASIQPALDSARWQGQRDLANARLIINCVGTADEFKRRGIASQLVQTAETWGRSRGATVAICDTAPCRCHSGNGAWAISGRPSSSGSRCVRGRYRRSSTAA